MQKKIKDFFPVGNTGLFSTFINPLWVNAFPDSDELDLYFTMRYGEKTAADFMNAFLDASGELTTEGRQRLAKVIYSINFKKWEHLFKVYNAEYNPLENTDFVETIKDTNSNIKTVDTDNTGTASTTGEASATGSSDVDNTKYGFDSASAVGDNESSGSTSGTSESSTSSETSSTEDSTITDNGTHDSEHRKHGNIGVTSTVTLMTEEKNFWKWSFIDAVCLDICDIIALSIYNY